ncbi:hypothetical protein LAV_00193 [Sphingobium phage Lacusarx]|uniref:Uncharacterized protein n=1 Tax=Sphingobium phage Lacusarx TaxID=1980139 RepID=A0A1W6DXC7_9CAUD|nr:hypothetical protein FDH44_gp110 [Sphingobium phage Lacusarx]ARK07568.1 hypothetical protein LAV_00193 [Sphingobium phage Lacusarx]
MTMVPTKDDLIRIFREHRGLHRIGAERSPYLNLDIAPSLPISFTLDAPPVLEVTIHTVRYRLRELPLGSEWWAYVECDGHVIVPPFEWLGYEFLSAHVW